MCFVWRLVHSCVLYFSKQNRLHLARAPGLLVRAVLPMMDFSEVLF